MSEQFFQPQIAFFIWSITAALAAAVIYRKGHHIVGALAVGIILGPLALLVAFFIPFRNNVPPS